MAIRVCNSRTPGTRTAALFTFDEITAAKPEKKLTKKYHQAKGRNNRGIITCRHRGGGHKKRYRLIDFKRNKHGIIGKVYSIEYDPNRNARIALIHYTDGEKRYILWPHGLALGDSIISGKEANLSVGNALPLQNIPVGTEIHNIELFKGRGGQIVRAAGTSARILAREGSYSTVRLPSKEVRLIHNSCYATIGMLGNREASSVRLGKAGRKRWLGITPTVRGSVMNPCDHPHGGGEGRAPIGRSRPSTPWGKAALGAKTRQKKRYSDNFIIRRRK